MKHLCYLCLVFVMRSTYYNSINLLFLEYYKHNSETIQGRNFTVTEQLNEHVNLKIALVNNCTCSITKLISRNNLKPI